MLSFFLHLTGMFILSLGTGLVWAQSLNPTGSISVHDPVMIKEDGTYYLFHTGSLVPFKTSSDMVNWRNAGSALSSAPAWWSELVPNRESGDRLWAPDIIYRNDIYWLYYAISSFGQNNSAIGLATKQKLASGDWQDEGVVIQSTRGDNHNAIDPNIVVDDAGIPWMSWGSFWTGLKIIQLDPETGKPAKDAEIISLAARPGVSENPIEAPFIIKRGDYYHLFLSFDFCCRGANSTYNMRYGRSTSVTGPFEDRSGTRMMEGGGTRMDDGSPYPGGHNAVFEEGGQYYLVYHIYSGNNARLEIRHLYFDDEAWPTLDSGAAVSTISQSAKVNMVQITKRFPLRIRINSPEIYSVQLFDLNGGLVSGKEEKGNRLLDMGRHKEGIYFLQLKVGTIEINRKVYLY